MNKPSLVLIIAVLTLTSSCFKVLGGKHTAAVVQPDGSHLVTTAQNAEVRIPGELAAQYKAVRAYKYLGEYGLEFVNKAALLKNWKLILKKTKESPSDTAKDIAASFLAAQRSAYATVQEVDDDSAYLEYKAASETYDRYSGVARFYKKDGAWFLCEYRGFETPPLELARQVCPLAQ